MICIHLRQLEQDIVAAGLRETHRGQTWTSNCREFVYFDCVFDRPSIRKRLNLPECVIDEEYLGTHMGEEYGFFCKECKDGIMGHHPKRGQNYPVFG